MMRKTFLLLLTFASAALAADGPVERWAAAVGGRDKVAVAMFSSVEICDGTNVSLHKGTDVKNLAGDELAVERSKAFANSNAIFFVFFPKRHRGSIRADGDDAIVFKPEGGVEWRVTLDPKTSLPSTMTHKEGDKTIAVSFASYETVDGIQFEKEIRRSNGEGRPGAIIRFTKTIINPTVDTSMFATEAAH